MKTRAIRIHQTGGPSVMKWEEVDLPNPTRGQILVRHTAIGFNFIDTYIRSGLYSRGGLPSGIGIEAAGVIERVGSGVKGFKVGDRIAYAGGNPPGSYAEARVMTTNGVFKVPSWMDDETAACVLSKGRTVEYLFNRTHKLKKGETILFQAAAGGVGLIACQWARAVGAKVIGTVGTPEKARLAKRFGCNHPIVTKKPADLVKEVMRITKGVGVDVVYDSIGKDLWEASLDSVKRLGLVVSFGSASGSPPPFDVASDGLKKSIYLHRATTPNYMTSREIEEASGRKVFSMVKKGAIKISVNHAYPLKDAVKMHREAEARKTSGQVILIP